MMATSTSKQQDMQMTLAAPTLKGKRTSPEARAKRSEGREDEIQPEARREAVAPTAMIQEMHTEAAAKLKLAMESTAEVLGIPTREVMDMSPILNVETSEARLIEGNTHTTKERLQNRRMEWKI